ncbi:MAG: transcriptional repressor [Proteobacteria bacterium]|nr:transcriptional repressor [Pseudomonadota bacterium]
MQAHDREFYAREVNTSPPDLTAHPRRNHSRQREEILDWVRRTETHPTAAEIHDALIPDRSDLSLGTVYRNLEILVADGDLDEVRSSSGATRYDGNRQPHHHFSCDRCGCIVDIDLPEPRGLKRRLAREHGLEASRVRISISGICQDCRD